MARMGSFNGAGLKKFEKQLEKIKPEDSRVFIEGCAKELAARLLSKVIKKTPVGVYPASTGKVGGTLRRGWTSRSHQEAASGSEGNVAAYVNSLEIRHEGDMYTIEIVNPVSYASYVEYGHRTRGGKGWVEGRFMLTVSEQEINELAPRLLEAKIMRYLGECMK